MSAVVSLPPVTTRERPSGPRLIPLAALAQLRLQPDDASDLEFVFGQLESLMGSRSSFAEQVARLYRPPQPRKQPLPGPARLPPPEGLIERAEVAQYMPRADGRGVVRVYPGVVVRRCEPGPVTSPRNGPVPRAVSAGAAVPSHEDPRYLDSHYWLPHWPAERWALSTSTRNAYRAGQTTACYRTLRRMCATRRGSFDVSVLFRFYGPPMPGQRFAEFRDTEVRCEDGISTPRKSLVDWGPLVTLTATVVAGARAKKCLPSVYVARRLHAPQDRPQTMTRPEWELHKARARLEREDFVRRVKDEAEKLLIAASNAYRTMKRAMGEERERERSKR